MHGVGKLEGCWETNKGELIVQLAIKDSNKAKPKIEKLMNDEIAFDFDKYSPNRGLNANAYFWSLCDKIAKVLRTDKDAVHVLEIRRYGVFDQYDVVAEQVPIFKKFYIDVETKYTYTKRLFTAEGAEVVTTMAHIMAYKHSHEYSSRDFALLLNGTIEDAHDLGIETWSQEEVDNLIARWQGK